MISFFRCCIFVFLFVFTLTAFAQTPCEPGKNAPTENCRLGDSDTATARQKIQQFQDVVKAKISKNMSADQKQMFLNSMYEYFDFATMAEAALFGEWDKRTIEERARFTVAFTSMLQRNYLKKLYDHANYTITIVSEKIKEDKAQISTRLSRNAKSAATIDVTYRLHKTKTGWRIYDVLTDEVSLVRNYRSTFSEILKNKGFSGLLEHLQSQSSGPLP